LLQLPFEDINTALDLIGILCKNSIKVVCSATLLAPDVNDDDTVSPLSVDAFIDRFKLNEDPKKRYVRIESSRRDNIHRICINPNNLFSTKALNNPATMLTQFHLPNIKTMHLYAILCNGTLLVYCNGDKEAKKVRDAYMNAYPTVPASETDILSGTKSMKSCLQLTALEHINDVIYRSCSLQMRLVLV
jgi:hypothetical protein